MRLLLIGSLNGPIARTIHAARTRGIAIDHADEPRAALAALHREHAVDVILCDARYEFATVAGDLPIIAYGPAGDSALEADAIAAGAVHFIALPMEPDLILARIEALATHRGVPIAHDPVMIATVRRAEQIARSSASVLIHGESGTGKEVLARHIHQTSQRSGGPFIAVNCAAIPDNLIESELFGHEKGAFSGAMNRRIGRFEAADKGTLLLDEIGELDIRLQAKLLRAVQEREVDRLGGAAPIRVDVRILAATNRDLRQDVVKGRFREDLYFRLNVVSLRIPPLRERPADVVILADHFARTFARANGLPYRPITDAAMRRLMTHRWSGNVRELENTLHRAVILADGSQIDTDAIELPLTGASVPERVRGGDPVADLVGRRVEEVERDLIIETLGYTLGNRTQAATILGISIRALRNKLRDYSAQGARIPPPAAGMVA